MESVKSVVDHSIAQHFGQLSLLSRVGRAMSTDRCMASMAYFMKSVVHHRIMQQHLRQLSLLSHVGRAVSTDRCMANMAYFTKSVVHHRIAQHLGKLSLLSRVERTMSTDRCMASMAYFMKSDGASWCIMASRSTSGILLTHSCGTWLL